MILLPNIKPYEASDMQTIPADRNILPVYMALHKGMKHFRDEEFVCVIPKEHQRDYTVLHMSSIGHCGRKEFFHRYYTERYDTREMSLRLRIPPPYNAFALGNMIEAYTLHLLKLGGLLPFEEQKELSDLNGKITGHIDALVRIEGKEYLIEIKGLKSESISLLLSCGLKKAIPGYYSQMQYYMFCLKIEAGYLIALDKGTSKWYIEYVKLDSDHITFLRKKVLALHGLQAIEEIPEKFIVRDCRFCPLIDMCAEIEGQEKFIQNFVDSERRSIYEQSSL